MPLDWQLGSAGFGGAGSLVAASIQHILGGLQVPKKGICRITVRSTSSSESAQKQCKITKTKQDWLLCYDFNPNMKKTVETQNVSPNRQPDDSQDKGLQGN